MHFVAFAEACKSCARAHIHQCILDVSIPRPWAFTCLQMCMRRGSRKACAKHAGGGEGSEEACMQPAKKEAKEHASIRAIRHGWRESERACMQRRGAGGERESIRAYIQSES